MAKTTTTHPGELLGWISGWMVAPVFAAISFARAARTFHPRGSTLHADVRRHPAAPPELRALADRIAGPALVRFSGALWKRTQLPPDVLGCAIRLRRIRTDDTEPAHDDQDLLFATIRRPWTLLLAPLATHVSDYLQNDYYAVSPFDVGAPRPIYLRLCPRRVSRERTGRRSARLAAAIQRDARLELECSAKPYGPWQSLAEIRFERPAHLDDDDLRFSPFRTGRSIRPNGFVHALRRGVYQASQRARDARR